MALSSLFDSNKFYSAFSAVTISEMLKILHEAAKISADTFDKCKEFISTTQLTTLPRHLETAKKPNVRMLLNVFSINNNL